MPQSSSSSIDFEQLKTNADKASTLLKSLSHPDRLMLMCQLVDGPACVSDLETLTGLTQPSLSQQLGVLRNNNLVSTERNSRQIIYSIASEDALAVMQVLYERFCHSESDVQSQPK